ncbi:MAG: SUMF1/EgtB/PvdO family nonheme iron enzyme [Gammaproteobacteria bacterium]|nr:SUMF1/EgtB/PvdO family nonheme iron enzyme [Gammaproteobacteria bacterium]
MRAFHRLIFALFVWAAPGPLPLSAQEPGPLPALRMDPMAAPLSAAAQAAMVPIPGGEYPVGHDRGRSDARPAHRVKLGSFAIDRTEVTNAQFAEFLNALGLEVRSDFAYSRARREHFSERSWPELMEQGIKPGLYPLIGLDDDQVRIEVRDGRFAAARGFEDHPVAETTWRGARNYCDWRGARLPTEVEWEAAARGFTGRTYPWGNQAPSPTLAYFGYPSGVTAPVGSRPDGATPEGVLDLAGSLAEWTASLYRQYPYDPGDGREDLEAAGERVTRGGDYVFDIDADQLTGYFRGGYSRAPQNGHRHIGFRCARPLS